MASRRGVAAIVGPGGVGEDVRTVPASRDRRLQVAQLMVSVTFDGALVLMVASSLRRPPRF